MSQKELKRSEILSKVTDKRMTIQTASIELGLSWRQTHRLVKAFRKGGAAALVSKSRGKPSNRSYSVSYRQYVISVVREHYHDFGSTLAAEKLSSDHAIIVSREALRVWMIDAGLWKTRKQKRGRVHQPRHRRECFGELVQIDGSDHEWFEHRAPRCTLLVYIDDATSTLTHLRFVKSESAIAYFNATRAYLEDYGKPVAFYSDKHSVFHVSKSSTLSNRGLTQFGRALEDLNIEIICANTSQAKGRVERANKTLQDRLVKEMRLRGISSIEEGNAYLEEYRAAHNAKFAKSPRNAKDLHRPLAEHDRLDEAFSWQVTPKKNTGL